MAIGACNPLIAMLPPEDREIQLVVSEGRRTPGCSRMARVTIMREVRSNMVGVQRLREPVLMTRKAIGVVQRIVVVHVT